MTMKPLYPIPFLTLAPMEGLADHIVRRLLAQIGGIDLCVSEFIRVTNMAPPNHVLRRLVPEIAFGWMANPETPIFPQLLGSNAEILAKCAINLVSLGAPGIDLNFGCPSRVVNRHGGGSVLLRNPKRIYRIVKAVNDAVGGTVPVTVKIRLGWDNPQDVFRVSDAVQKGGAYWIVIHARTKSDGFSNRTRWDLLKQVKKNLSIPLIANGGIMNAEDFHRCQDVTGCDYFMIGRGAIRDPYLFHKIRSPKRPVPCNLDSFVKKYASEISKVDAKAKYKIGRIKQLIKYMSHDNKSMKVLFDVISPVRQVDKLNTILDESLSDLSLRAA